MSVQVLGSCPERWTVVEAVVAVAQPQASGQASFPLTCIGSLGMFTVVVPSTGGTFELGEALATASVTIKRGKTERAQDSQVVLVQPAVFVELANTARLESGGGAVLIDVTRVQASRGVYQAGDAQALTFANVEHEGIGTAGVDDGPIQIVA
jgi:hypothetical protein